MAFGGAVAESLVTSVGVPEPSLLHEYFERQVARRPYSRAVEANGEMLTYVALDRRANQIAHWLRTQGVGPGCLVGLYLTKSVNLFAALLGILKAGAGYVPVDPKFPAERVRDIFADAGVRAVVTETKLVAALGAESGASVLVADRDTDELARQPLHALPDTPAPSPDGVCYVIYTSGSTGRPKGVMIAHRNAIAFVKTLRSIYRITSHDRIYQGFSVAFDASVEEVWAAFSIGGTLVVAPEDVARSPLDVAEFLTANRVTYFSTVPTFLAMIGAELPTVRILVLGGEACMPELVARWAKPNRRLLNTYGPTEATVVATWAECVAGEPVTIGKALPGYETYVLDESLEPVEAGQEGELFIGGAGVALGYLNRPELTAERFIDNPFRAGDGCGDRLYRTHDLVRPMQDGQLQFLGRIDGQIKIRGFRVELSEIEAVLMEYPGIRAAAVRVATSGGMQELAACVVADEAAVLVDRTGIAELLRSRLPEYMIPKYLDELPSLPTLTSGKVDRKQLPAPVSLLKGAEREAVPPADDLERAIALAWEACLRVAPISVEDDFFLDLGGHSLLAAQVVTELRSRLGTAKISVRDLYKTRTVRALGAQLRELGIAPLAAGAAPAASTSEPTASERAFRLVPAWERWLVVLLQACSVTAFYGIVAAPAAYLIVMLTAVADGDVSRGTALWITTIVGFAVYPCMLALSISLKWLVIGRYKPGRYPVWSLYYFRWWLVNRFQALAWAEMFVGSPLMSLYYRAMGASIGKDVTLCTPYCSAFDLVSIGDGSSIGSDTHLLGHRVEDGMLIIGRVEIGRDCFVGMHSCLGLGVRLGDGARVDDMSLLVDGTVVPAGEGRRGSPAAAADVRVPQPEGRKPKRRPILFGFLHLVLIYMMGYFLILSMLPGVVLVLYALATGGTWWGLAAAFLAVPIGVLWYCIQLVAVKWACIGRMRAGVHPVHSRHYLKHWFLDYLLNNSRSIVLTLYATLFFPTLLRLLGAKIGPGTEISTVIHISPDQLEVGGGSFLADACLVGGQRVHNGVCELQANRIGEKSFVGNSAMLPGGTDMGDEALLGVLSAPPPDLGRIPDGARLLGSPAFALPNPRQELSFNDAQTYAPTRAAYCMRAAIDALRVLLPGFIMTGALVVFATYLIVGYRDWPLWAVVAFTPLLSVTLGFAAIAMVAGVKWLMMGRYEPTVQPLWCPYVWYNEVVNGAYESVAETAMAPMMGTPLIATAMRMMGCKVGKWVYLETTFFSEFDLVEIDDYAALNFGSTIQTHLFEDRVMKADYLRIGQGCTVGNMAVVLYSTAMQRGSSLGPLSVLMKGETLPAGSRWYGIPSEPVDGPAAGPSAAPRRGPVRRTIDAIATGCVLVVRSPLLAARFVVSLPRRTGRGNAALARRLRHNVGHTTEPGRRLATAMAATCEAVARRLDPVPSG